MLYPIFVVTGLASGVVLFLLASGIGPEVMGPAAGSGPEAAQTVAPAVPPLSSHQLTFGGKRVDASLVVANSSDLLYDTVSRRVLRLSASDASLSSTSYVISDRDLTPRAAALGSDGTLALLVDIVQGADAPRLQAILELGLGGATELINLPPAVGRLETIALWKDGTYILSPQCAPFLAVHVARTGKLLESVGQSQCSRSATGSRFATHSAVFANSEFSRIYTVDTLEGNIRVWGADYQLRREIPLPRHPRYAEMAAAMRAESLNRILTVHLYGIPTSSADGLLLIPGIRADTHRTAFGVDMTDDSLRRYKPIAGVGPRILGSRKEVALIDNDPMLGATAYLFGKLEVQQVEGGTK